MSTLQGVQADDVPSAWHIVSPLVHQYLTESREHRWEAADILAMILERDAQLWLVVGDAGLLAVVITRIVQYPQAKECDLFMVHGELPDDWPAHLEQLCTWAQAQGCESTAAMARKGQARRFDGWQSRQIYIVRD
ncbi:hypothetical protein D3C81_478290 [compost metagenome]